MWGKGKERMGGKREWGKGLEVSRKGKGGKGKGKGGKGLEVRGKG